MTKRGGPPIIGRRVVAWTGPRADAHGEVIRVDGATRFLIRWDDGSEDWYRNADVFLEQASPEARDAYNGYTDES